MYYANLSKLLQMYVIFKIYLDMPQGNISVEMIGVQQRHITSAH